MMFIRHTRRYRGCFLCLSDVVRRRRVERRLLALEVDRVARERAVAAAADRDARQPHLGARVPLGRDLERERRVRAFGPLRDLGRVERDEVVPVVHLGDGAARRVEDVPLLLARERAERVVVVGGRARVVVAARVVAVAVDGVLKLPDERRGARVKVELVLDRAAEARAQRVGRRAVGPHLAVVDKQHVVLVVLHDVVRLRRGRGEESG